MDSVHNIRGNITVSLLLIIVFFSWQLVFDIEIHYELALLLLDGGLKHLSNLDKSSARKISTPVCDSTGFTFYGV